MGLVEDSERKIACSLSASKPSSSISKPKNNDMFGNVSEERSESSSYHIFFSILIKVMLETHFLKRCCSVYVKRHNLEELLHGRVIHTIRYMGCAADFHLIGIMKET